MTCKHKKLYRVLSILVTLGLMAGVFLVAPQQLGVALAKVSLATIASVTGFWIDRTIFPYACPDDIRTRADRERDEEVKIALMDSFDSASIRRAVIIAAVIIGVCLGL